MYERVLGDGGGTIGRISAERVKLKNPKRRSRVMLRAGRLCKGSRSLEGRKEGMTVPVNQVKKGWNGKTGTKKGKEGPR